MHIANCLTDLIGSTPLLKLNRFAPEAKVLAKLECMNPLSSAKDRAALYMIQAASLSTTMQTTSVQDSNLPTTNSREFQCVL